MLFSADSLRLLPRTDLKNAMKRCILKGEVDGKIETDEKWSEQQSENVNVNGKRRKEEDIYLREGSTLISTITMQGR